MSLSDNPFRESITNAFAETFIRGNRDLLRTPANPTCVTPTGAEIETGPETVVFDIAGTYIIGIAVRVCT
jgi:hypothetical protein